MEPSGAPTSRYIILSRIRNALLPQAMRGVPEESWAAVPRAFRCGSDAPPDAVLDLLANRLHDYDAQVLRAGRGEIPQQILRMLAARGVESMLIPHGFPEALLPKGCEYIRDEGLSSAALEACGGVITTCTLAIAETGTIVLQNAPGQGRRAASLVPDYHLCLIDASQVVATVPEAVAALQATSSLPTTCISGPSATADIEMTRIKGVHGPRFLDVILIA